jgi:ABC-2 type transport system permease protein
VEVWRDPLSLGLTVGLPLVLLLVLQALGGVEAFFRPTTLVPGIVLFGYVMLMFGAAMNLSRDRERALFSRMLTAPLRSNDFVAAYSLPYLPVAVLQAVVLFAIGAFLGLEIVGNPLLVVLVLVIAAVFYIALGMILGAVFTIRQVPFLYAAVLLLTVFGGAWMDLDAIGGPIQASAVPFPFVHALDATRAVMVDGAGVGAIAPDLAWVAGYALVAGALAVLLFRRKMLE